MSAWSWVRTLGVRDGVRRLSDLQKMALLVGLIILVGAVGGSDVVAQRIESDRAGCERLNRVRESVYATDTVLVTATQQQIEAIKSGATPTPAQQSLGGLSYVQGLHDDYMRKREQLIDSAAQFADRPGSVTVDCSRAYPYPFPGNLF